MTRHRNTGTQRENQYRAGRARDLALRWLADDHPDEYRALLLLARDEVNRRRDASPDEPPRHVVHWNTDAPGVGAIKAVMEANGDTRTNRERVA